jgi:hypothetical protein
MIIVLCFGLFLATSAWGQPSNWAVKVPTRAQYTGSGGASFYSDYVNDHFWCSYWDLTGINHFVWECCCGGDPGHLEPHVPPYQYFDFYDILGEYYDCNGNLIESNARIGGGGLSLKEQALFLAEGSADLVLMIYAI